MIVRDNHKKTHTRHPRITKKKKILNKIDVKETNILEETSVLNKDEIEQIQQETSSIEPKESYAHIFENEDNMSDSLQLDAIQDSEELQEEKDLEKSTGLTSKIATYVKNQKEQHKVEKTANIQRIKEAKDAKYEQKQNLKIRKLEMKEAKASIKQAKKELKAAKKQNRGLLSAILITIFAAIALFLFFVVNWLFTTWPNLQMSELVYEATAPLEGTGNEQILNFIKLAIVPTGIVLLLVIIFMILISNAGMKIRKRGKQLILIISCVFMAIGCFRVYTRLDLGNYVKSQTTSSDFIELNYVDPSSIEMTFPETKRNLIMIYCESMEMTYSDTSNGGAFDVNYIPELTQLSKENENFSGTKDMLNGAHSLSYATWTIAGLFASTSGLPLQTNLNDYNDMDTQDSFFPSITTLGDMLEDQGYTNIFACGSDATFGGRRLYFTSHGDYECRDINYRKENGQLEEDYYVWWGFEDSKLIEWAKEDLSTLGESEEPFNYTMLTVDTHFEDGYYCDQCVDQWGEQYANVISCSSRQVSELVSWIQQQSWYENTTIVLTGDHPTMDADFCASLTDYDRRVYTAYINAAPVEYGTEGMRTYSTFDTFPTVVSSLGVSITGNKLGLGTNLFSGERTLTEQLGIEEENAELDQKSEFMQRISAVDMESSTVREREGITAKATVSVDAYEDQVATFRVDNIYNTAGTLQSVEMTLTDSSGNTEVKQMKYQGDGSFKVDMRVPDDSIDYVYLKVEFITQKDGEEVREVPYECAGPLWLMAANESSLTNYLEDLQSLDKSRYTIFMTMQAETGENLSDEDKNLLSSLGASSLVDGGGNASFAVISGDEVYTRSGNEYIRDNSTLESGVPFVIASSANELQASSIIIGWDYQEYCPQGNGINIVVWDNLNNGTVKQSVFDCNTLTPTASISTKTSMINKNVTLNVDDLENIDDVFRIIAIAYDADDANASEQFILSLNEDGHYEAVLKDYKNVIDEKVIKIYAVTSDNTQVCIGTLETDKKD